MTTTPKDKRIPDMTEANLRDYFAGQALAGVAEEVIEGMAENGPHDPYADIAWVCYQIADAMLALRETDND
jgi:hypothetical protein